MNSTVGPYDAATLEGFFRTNEVLGYMAVAMCALLISDYLHTLPAEIKYIWPSKWSTPKYLYTLLRVHGIIFTSICVYCYTSRQYSGKDCAVPQEAEAYSALVLVSICEAIAYFRTYAFSLRNKWLGAFLVVFYIAIHSVQYSFLAIYFKGTTFLDVKDVPALAGAGCVWYGDEMAISIVFISYLISLTTVTFIIIYMAYQKRRRSHGVEAASGIAKIFYKDGVAFFIMMSSLATMNIILGSTVPTSLPGFRTSMVIAQSHVTAILMGRMLIHLRQFADRDVTISGGVSPWSRPLTGSQEGLDSSIEFRVLEITQTCTTSTMRDPDTTTRNV